MNERRCFVIQPFGEETYEKRYRDVFEPAIRDAEVEPYRVDGDPGADVIISSIEEGIKESDLCFAEITTDNPNVWYELGYARALGKHVTMVCEEDRKLPFDIQHRRVILYKQASTSDFDNLKEKITDSIKTALDKEDNIKKLAAPVSVSLDYKMPPHILTALVVVASNEDLGAGVGLNQIKREMNQAGFNNLASNLATRQLIHDGFLTEGDRSDEEEGYVYRVVLPTEKALKWLFQNQDDLNLRLPVRDTSADDDLPF